MTDINPPPCPAQRPTRSATDAGGVETGDVRAGAAENGAGAAQQLAMVELLFFAYRDFTGEADHVLAAFGFGRAHHRVLHFVRRNPGLCVAELLDILRITKQSLNRVLKQLVAEGYIEQRAGRTDRRMRQLHVTGKGADLADRLMSMQQARVSAALAGLDLEGMRGAEAFLLAMISPEQRDLVGLRTGTLPALVAGEDPRREMSA